MLADDFRNLSIGETESSANLTSIPRKIELIFADKGVETASNLQLIKSPVHLAGKGPLEKHGKETG